MNENELGRGASTMPELRNDMSAWLEDAWMQRYLDRELSTAECDWFEAYCLDREHLVARLDADLALRDALARELAPPAREPPTQMPARVRTSAAMPRALATAAMAAGVLIGAAGTAWIERDSAPAALSTDVTRVFFDSLRGEADDVRVHHAGSASEFVIYDVAVPPDATLVTLHVGGEADRPLQLDADGIATALLSRELARTRDIAVSYRRGAERVQRRLALPGAGDTADQSRSPQ